MKFVGSLVAHEASLADGVPLAGGVEYDLNPAERGDPHNARLIAEGQLLAVNNTDKVREEAESVLTNKTPMPSLTSPPEPDGGSS